MDYGGSAVDATHVRETDWGLAGLDFSMSGSFLGNLQTKQSLILCTFVAA